LSFVTLRTHVAVEGAPIHYQMMKRVTWPNAKWRFPVW